MKRQFIKKDKKYPGQDAKGKGPKFGKIKNNRQN